PGTYTLTYDLQGFTKVTKPDVSVSVGQNTNTAASLKLSSVQASVTVKGESPLLETRRVGTGATVNTVELQSIPTARDPWVVMQSVPGIQVDRVNVGGNEGGQQSSYVGKGSGVAQGVWNVDGVTITDMGALGSSPAYYDFDSFEEMQVSTGGSDLTASTPGVQLNMVTKRGTNDVHGSARMYLGKNRWGSENLPSEAREQGRTGGGNSIDEVQDYGVEVGGPLWKDRAWLWGSYGRQQINVFTIIGTSDKTTLEGVNSKLNLQITDGTSATGFYSRDDKLKFGRNASLTRPGPTAWNQDGPTTIWKGELSQVFSSTFFATASGAYVDGGFELLPIGGLGVDAYKDSASIWHDSYLVFQTIRPQHQWGANASYFFNTGSIGHELKFGFQYRKTPVNSHTGWPGSGNVGIKDETPNKALLTRTATYGATPEYFNGFLGDTLTTGNLTINAGVRYDLQRGQTNKATVEANSIAPDILPGFSVDAGERSIEWKDFEPRVGLTYALGPQRKLLLKGSYARFADQLGSASLNQRGAIPGYSYLAYDWVDANSDNHVQRNELDFSHINGFYNIDPTNPTGHDVFNQTSPNLKAGKTDEFIAGADYELIPDFVVGANYTYRKYKNALCTNTADLCNGIGQSSADFVPTTVTTNVYTGFGAGLHEITVPVYALGIPAASGTVLDNRGSYESTFNGVGLTATKRLSNRWMMRGSFGYGEPKQKSGSTGCFDPNNQLSTTYGASCPSNDITAPRAAGSGAKSGVFIHAKWNFNVSGMYQLPAGFNVAGNIFGRQGYPYVHFIRVNPGDDFGTRDIITDRTGNPVGAKLDGERYDNVYNVDVRLEKVIELRPLQVSLALDVFNVLNSDTVLQRNGRVNQATFNRIEEVQAPRVLRLGARITF
ncbi:MAG: hypothetical protein ABI592_15255, partial [Acidobacteriota bacterium]